MEYSYITDPGKVRERNEDCVNIVTNEKDEKLLIVADGMGGHKNVEIASLIGFKVLLVKLIWQYLNMFLSILKVKVWVQL